MGLQQRRDPLQQTQPQQTYLQQPHLDGTWAAGAPSIQIHSLQLLRQPPQLRPQQQQQPQQQLLLQLLLLQQQQQPLPQPQPQPQQQLQQQRRPQQKRQQQQRRVSQQQWQGELLSLSPPSQSGYQQAPGVQGNLPKTDQDKILW